MIALRLIEDARAHGLTLEVDGADLIVEADDDPPAELMAELRQHKAELIAALAPVRPEAASAAVAVQDADRGVDDLAERAALIEYGAKVPRHWAEGLAVLSSMPAPTGFSEARWRKIIDSAGGFLDKWTDTAIACGWTDLDVFGCNPDRPDARFDAMGLVLLLDRCEVVDIDDCGADLVTATGARQRYRRRPLPPGTVSLWQLMVSRGAA